MSINLLRPLHRAAVICLVLQGAFSLGAYQGSDKRDVDSNSAHRAKPRADSRKWRFVGWVERLLESR
jgi:hypothetical protein